MTAPGVRCRAAASPSSVARPWTRRRRRGRGWLEEGRRARPHDLGELRREEAQIIEHLAGIFPRLAERLGQQASIKSEGEQQMLAIARALAAAPRLVMLDEPSEGIMPVLVDELFAAFEALRRQGAAILLVQQNVELALQTADRAYVLDQRAVAHADSARAMLSASQAVERCCSV